MPARTASKTVMGMPFYRISSFAKAESGLIDAALLEANGFPNPLIAGSL